ncbi:30S ribosomal protein S17e [Candidatus Woesearchaeota archaeon]|nr:30S ribosomal protein S17e [Candidatus Woesearchaeota archaeon]
MGRIKTKLAKRITNQLIKLHGESFTKDFNDNKLVVQRLTTCTSNKLRNIIAGYASRLVKKAANN